MLRLPDSRIPTGVISRGLCARTRFSFATSLLLLAMICGGTRPETVWAGDQATQSQRDFFEKNVRPVLVRHCYECHSAASRPVQGGLRLDTRAGTLKGGDSGPAVVPAQVDKSLIIQALRYEGTEMPPKGKLPEAVIRNFEKWIAEGAVDPRTEETPAAADPSEAAKDHWAFQPLVPSTPPDVQQSGWPRAPLDHYILARLEENSLRPAEDAPAHMLLRRLYFDLTGLPPSPAEIEQWLPRLESDSETTLNEQALAELVDELLTSPRFGERWARHWLDIVRFSEANGGDRNVIWPHAWRYRSWVIDAFNNDLPYDQFLRDQIAGDLLPSDDPAERDRRLVATGFLTLGVKLFMETKAERFRMDRVDEQIDVISRSALALTVSCARCHDHKFDPIPTRDYHALAGILRSTYLLTGEAAPAGNQYGHDRPLQPIGRDAEKLHGPALKWKEAVAEQTSVRNKARSDRYRDVRKKAAQENVLKKLQESLPEAERETDPRVVELTEEIAGLAKLIAEWDGKISKLDEELKALQDNPPPFPDYAMAVRDDEKPEDTHIRLRGDYNRNGELVPRGFLTTALPSVPAPEIPTETSGRRELATWLTDHRNPLTPRVAINRIWQHLFGEGLVRSVDNFGVMGERPSHPELLDHLAVQFQQDGWSVKRMIRRIALSRTYRQAVAAVSPSDPDNRLLGRAALRRLEAEPLRDAMLAVSGELDLTPPSVSVVSTIEGPEFNSRVRLDPEFFEAPHRTVYLPIVRNELPSVLSDFGFADPSLVVGRRGNQTTVAPQLYLMNNPFVIARAEAAARRLLDQNITDDAARIRFAWLQCHGRPPTADEQAATAAFLAALRVEVVETPATEETSGTSTEEEAPRLTAEQSVWARFYHALFAGAEFRHLR